MTDSSPYPFPPHPQPQPSAAPHMQPPMVYVYEKPGWEYKLVVREAAEADLLSEEHLNELGSSGWELVGIVGLPAKVQYCFKRART
jgi:hypothetical protein